MKHFGQESGGIVMKLIVALGVVTFLFFFYLVRHPMFRFIAESWIVEDPLNKADALIVLSDDNFYADRATRAAELFREGKASLVVASGRRLRPSAGITELMEHDLIERGVPKDKILRVPQEGHSAIVVTSNYHTRRARYIFRHVFPRGIDVRVASARDGDFDPEAWWEKRKSSKLFMREILGMMVAVWERRHGTETSSASQGIVEGGKRSPLSMV